MSKITPMLIEFSVFLVIYFVATALTWPLRKGRDEEGIKYTTFLSFIVHLLGFISRPLVVLAVTGVVVWIGKKAFGWTTPYPEHFTAWLYFWELALLIGFIEGFMLQFYRLRGKLFPVPPLLRNIIRAAFLMAASFAVLHFRLDIDITPLLGASALATAVVGFALQGVLGNLLAGMSLHVVRSVVPSDWVAIGDVEGKVIQTNWRETRLQTIAGHIIVIPNSTVAAATIHNMSRPTPLRRHRILVGASYSDPPADVIDELIQSALAVPDVLREPPPSAYVTEYKDFGINYTLRFWTNQYHNRTPLEGDVMRMIWYRFKRRGIEIPFPMSDKVLTDLVDVIDHQRNQPPQETEIKRTLADLQRSSFVSHLLVDEKGLALLKESDLSGLATSVGRVHYTKGETIFCQGEPGDTCYVVVWGKVHGRVEYKDATQANEFDIGPGGLFGEMSLVTGLPRTATIIANEEVELLEISNDTLTVLLTLREDIPQVLSKLVAERAEQNRATFDKLKSLEASNVNESLKSASILKRFLRMLGQS